VQNESPQSKLADGCPEAFAVLYDSWSDRLFGYLVMLLGDHQDAQDALQETFVRVARHRSKLREVRDLGAYLFRIARNEANRLRGRRPKQSVPFPGEEFYTIDNRHQQSLAQHAAGLLSVLNTDQREVVYLKLYAKMTFAEIGQSLDIPQGTAATRYRRAIQKMRDHEKRSSES
jgi:RNA polymerase sigma-70 factor, ECF subfamily